MHLKKDKKLKHRQLVNKIWLFIFDSLLLLRRVKSLWRSVFVSLRWKHALRKVFIVFLIFMWIFSGWPQIFDFPPQVQKVHAAVVFQGASAIAASTGVDVTVTLPSHQAGDIFLLQVVVRDTDDTITITDWTQITAFADTGSKHWWFWKRATGSSETNPLVDKTTTSGDTYASVSSYRGAIPSGDPWESKGTVTCTGTANPVTLSGITTLTNGSLVVASFNDIDNTFNSANYSATDPSSLTSNMFLKSATGADGFNGSGSAVRTDAGVTGDVSISLSKTPDAVCGIVLGLKQNSPPSLTVSQPDGVDDTVTVGESYNITYDLSDSDSVVTVDFYYDIDNPGLNGTTTASCQGQVEGSGATCPWDTTGMASGDYYIYGIAADEATSVNDYSPGVITIQTGGTLIVDIVDDVGSSVASPSITMTEATFSFDYQTATGTFGISTEKIRVENTTAAPQWNLTIAADGGSTAFWDGAISDYDFNDPTASAGDGADDDAIGGQMTINASGGTLGGTCSATDITKGSSTSFSEGATDSVTLLTAGASADTSCYWDFTGINISQTIPAEQPADSASISMTLTVTAL